MLHSRLVRYIDEVAKRGSIRKAAEHLNVASTAVNRQILAFENELGVPIFERLPRRLRATAAGEVLINHIRKTLKEYERTIDEMNSLKGFQSGEVAIATFDNLAVNLLSHVTQSFRAKYPRVQVRVRTVVGSQIFAVVKEDDVDFGLAYDLPKLPELSVLCSFDTRIGIIVSPDHPFAGRTSARLLECVEYPIIISDKTTNIYATIQRAFGQSQVEFHPKVTSNSFAYIKQLVTNNEGVSFMTPLDILDEQSKGELAFVPIDDVNIGNQSLSLVRRSGLTLTSTASRFAEQIKDEMKALGLAASA